MNVFHVTLLFSEGELNFQKSTLDVPCLIKSAVRENLTKYENSGSQIFICITVDYWYKC